MFVECYTTTSYVRHNYTALDAHTLAFEQAWKMQTWGTVSGKYSGTTGLLTGGAGKYGETVD